MFKPKRYATVGGRVETPLSTDSLSGLSAPEAALGSSSYWFTVWSSVCMATISLLPGLFLLFRLCMLLKLMEHLQSNYWCTSLQILYSYLELIVNIQVLSIGKLSITAKEGTGSSLDICGMSRGRGMVTLSFSKKYADIP